MVVEVTLKDPDGFYESVRDAVREDVAKVSNLDDAEREALEESRTEGVFAVLEKWVQYQEYVTILFDTENRTATVKPRH